MIFFLKKQNKIFMYLFGLFILQNFKCPRVLRMHHFRPQNSPFVLNKNVLVQTIIITFIYLLALFIAQNLKKFLQWIQHYEDAPFLGPKWSICPNFFFLKIIIILIYLLAPFIVQNLKKNFFCGSRVMRMCNFWVQNGPFPQVRIFSENLLMSLVSFIHAYTHAKN